MFTRVRKYTDASSIEYYVEDVSLLIQATYPPIVIRYSRTDLMYRTGWIYDEISTSWVNACADLLVAQERANASTVEYAEHLIERSRSLPTDQAIETLLIADGFGENPEVSVELARIDAKRGKPAAAVEQISRAFTRGLTDWVRIVKDPLFKDIRHHADFISIISRMWRMNTDLEFDANDSELIEYINRSGIFIGGKDSPLQLIDRGKAMIRINPCASIEYFLEALQRQAAHEFEAVCYRGLACAYAQCHERTKETSYAEYSVYYIRRLTDNGVPLTDIMLNPCLKSVREFVPT